MYSTCMNEYIRVHVSDGTLSNMVKYHQIGLSQNWLLIMTNKITINCRDYKIPPQVIIVNEQLSTRVTTTKPSLIFL